MKTLHNEIAFGHKDIKLFIDVSIEGKGSFTVEGHSLTQGFIAMLYPLLSGRYFEQHNPLKYPDVDLGLCVHRSPADLPNQSSWNSEKYTVNNEDYMIRGISNTTPIVVTGDITGSAGSNGSVFHYGTGGANVLSSKLPQTGDQIWIDGVEGNTAANGFWEVNRLSTSEFELVGSVGNGVWTELVDPQPAIGIFTKGLPNRHTASTSWGFGNRYRFSPGTNTSDSYACLTLPQIQLGKNIAPVTLADYRLHSPIYGLVPLGVTFVAEPVVGATTSTIVISRQFQNVVATNIDVKEIGIVAHGFNASVPSTYQGIPYQIRASDDNSVEHSTASRIFYDISKVLIARDSIAFTVAPSDTVSVNYRIVVNTPVTGGLLIQFNELLYRVFINANRESKNVFNQNVFLRSASNQLLCDSDFITSSHPQSSYNFIEWMGIQVGTSSDDVANTYFRMQNNLGEETRIPNGKGAGQLVHSRTEVLQPVFDYVNNEAWIDIEKIFTNVSGASININQIGVYTLNSGQRTTYPTYDSIHCIASNKLAAPFVVGNNTSFLARYRIKIEVGVV